MFNAENKTKLVRNDSVFVYDDGFFLSESMNSSISSKVVVPILIELLNPTSVVDMGCGAGAFLEEFRNFNITDLLGLDNSDIDPKYLLFDRNKILKQNLTEQFSLKKKFELAICLEVAEHIDEGESEVFIDNLSNLSDVILFSAAIPGQGGTHHVNEQWPEYWAEKFKNRNFVPFDIIRPLLWNISNIDPIYAQNSILYIKKEKIELYPNLGGLKAFSHEKLLPLIHPEIYTKKVIKNHKVSNPHVTDLISFAAKVWQKIVGS